MLMIMNILVCKSLRWCLEIVNKKALKGKANGIKKEGNTVKSLNSRRICLGERSLLNMKMSTIYICCYQEKHLLYERAKQGAQEKNV